MCKVYLKLGCKLGFSFAKTRDKTQSQDETLNPKPTLNCFFFFFFKFKKKKFKNLNVGSLFLKGRNCGREGGQPRQTQASKLKEF
jgi:hypothetical protein